MSSLIQKRVEIAEIELIDIIRYVAKNYEHLGVKTEEAVKKHSLSNRRDLSRYIINTMIQEFDNNSKHIDTKLQMNVLEKSENAQEIYINRFRNFLNEGLTLDLCIEFLCAYGEVKYGRIDILYGGGKGCL